MDLKKLYGDLTMLLGREIPVYTFLLQADLCARTLLCRYPKKLLLAVGEYVAPETISDTIALHEAFFPALLYGIAGGVSGEADFIKAGEAAAEDAYRTLWRAHARGKRRKGDVW